MLKTLAAAAATAALCALAATGCGSSDPNINACQSYANAVGFKLDAARFSRFLNDMDDPEDDELKAYLSGMRAGRNYAAMENAFLNRCHALGAK